MSSSDQTHALLSVKLQPSQQLGYFIIGIHAISLICIGLYTAPQALKIVLSFLVVLQAACTYRHFVLFKSPHSIIQLECTPHGKWFLVNTQLQLIAAELLGSSVVTHYLIILHFKSDAFFKRSVLLLRDSISKEEWRKLRVYLSLH